MGSPLCERWYTVGPTGQTKLDPPKTTATLRNRTAPIHIGSQQPTDYVGFPTHAPTELALRLFGPEAASSSNFARCPFLKVGHVSRRHFAGNNKLGLLNQNNVAALIDRPAEQNYRAAIRSRARWGNFNDFALNMEYVSGTRRCRPAQLSPGADEAVGEWRTALDIQTHRDRSGMPTARRQTLEERALSGLLVRVKGL